MSCLFMLSYVDRLQDVASELKAHFIKGWITLSVLLTCCVQYHYRKSSDTNSYESFVHVGWSGWILQANSNLAEHLWVTSLQNQSLDWNQRQFGRKQNISLILMLYDQFRNDRKIKSHFLQQDVWTCESNAEQTARCSACSSPAAGGVSAVYSWFPEQIRRPVRSFAIKTHNSHNLLELHRTR